MKSPKCSRFLIMTPPLTTVSSFQSKRTMSFSLQSPNRPWNYPSFVCSASICTKTPTENTQGSKRFQLERMVRIDGRKRTFWALYNWKG